MFNTFFSIFTVLMFWIPSFASEVYDLRTFDGSASNIMGPMGMPVPKTFFTESQIEVVANGLNFYAKFSSPIEDLSKKNLVIHNLKENSRPIPVTLSVISPSGNCHNFIITLPDSNEIELTLYSKVLEISQQSIDNGNIDKSLTFFIISGQPISLGLKNKTGRTIVDALEVTPPNNDQMMDEISKTLTLANPCTSIEGIYPVTLINDQDGVESDAYLRVTDAYLTFPSIIRHWTSIRIDYPNLGNKWHYGTNNVPSDISLFDGSCLYPENYAHRTSTTKVCGHQMHTWSGIFGLTHFGDEASAESTYGCQRGKTWRVLLIN